MPSRVLFVDDDINILNAFKRGLRKQVSLVTAQGGEEGLAAIKAKGPFSVIISDQQMPGMDGVTFLKQAKETSPLSVRMMLTGNADQQTATAAVNEGHIFRFLNKPCAPPDIVKAIEAAQKQYDLLTAERELLEKTLAGSVKVLVDVLALRDPGSFRETARIRGWAKPVAEVLGITDTWSLDMAIMLAPLGHITLPAQLCDRISRGAKLSLVEQELVAQTPQVARDLISNIPRLEAVADAVYYQAKGFDGSGFPTDDRAGEDLPLAARVVKVLSDLATATGPKGEPDGRSFAELNTQSELYDPRVLDAARHCLLHEHANFKPGRRVEQLTLKFSGLRPDDALASDLVAEDGTLLLAEGQQISSAMIQKLLQLGRLRMVQEPVSVLREVIEAEDEGEPEKQSA